MRITRSGIVDLLEEQGDMGVAHQADVNLPSEVDSERDAAVLNTIGVDVEALLNTR